MSTATEFDLHGIVGIRIIGASRRELSDIGGQLGLPSSKLTRPPDITIQFMHKLAVEPDERVLGAYDASFSDMGYVVLRGKARAPVRMRIPFDQLGSKCELTLERGAIGGIPLLIAIINLTAVGRGVIPIHASAFRHAGRTVLVTGWAKGGKSEVLLAFASQGASYIGDEWIYVDPATKEAVGIPEPMRLWDWQLKSLPAARRAVSVPARTRLALLGAVSGTGGAMLRSRRFRSSHAGSLVNRATNLVERQRSVQVPPDRLFDSTATKRPAVIDRLVHVSSHRRPSVEVHATSGETVADRMVHSIRYEMAPLFEEYLRFRYAFPARRNDLMEDPARISTLLHQALDPLPAAELRHPYPVDIPALYRPLSEWLKQD